MGLSPDPGGLRPPTCPDRVKERVGVPSGAVGPPAGSEPALAEWMACRRPRTPVRLGVGSVSERGQG